MKRFVLFTALLALISGNTFAAAPAAPQPMVVLQGQFEAMPPSNLMVVMNAIKRVIRCTNNRARIARPVVEDRATCPLCYDGFEATSVLQHGPMVTCLNAQVPHAYHLGCITPWLTNQQANPNRFCPMQDAMGFDNHMLTLATNNHRYQLFWHNLRQWLTHPYLRNLTKRSLVCYSLMMLLACCDTYYQAYVDHHGITSYYDCMQKNYVGYALEAAAPIFTRGLPFNKILQRLYNRLDFLQSRYDNCPLPHHLRELSFPSSCYIPNQYCQPEAVCGERRLGLFRFLCSPLFSLIVILTTQFAMILAEEANGYYHDAEELRETAVQLFNRFQRCPRAVINAIPILVTLFIPIMLYSATKLAYENLLEPA